MGQIGRLAKEVDQYQGIEKTIELAAGGLWQRQKINLRDKKNEKVSNNFVCDDTGFRLDDERRRSSI